MRRCLPPRRSPNPPETEPKARLPAEWFPRVPAELLRRLPAEWFPRRAAEVLVPVPSVIVKQVRSTNGTSPKQRETLRSLKLGRIGRASNHADSPELRGMLRVVDHLVEITGEGR
jgi:large subunit ribosomal protein L30